MHAVRFRQFISQDALDFAHGGGAWHDCLYLPDSGVVCQVTWENEVLDANGQPWHTGANGWAFNEYVQMLAYHGRLEDQLADRPKSPEGRKAPEDIQIPASLARGIIALADDTERQRATSRRLGKECVAVGAVGDKSTVGARDF